jgi:hypothetical protein
VPVPVPVRGVPVPARVGGDELLYELTEEEIAVVEGRLNHE